MAVRRFDRGTAGKAQRLDNGWVRAPAAFTRAGIFEYRNPDGTTRRELRHPDDVFKMDSLQTLSMLPLTNEHPDVGLLDATNAKKYSVGSTGESVKQDGDRVTGTVMVTDGDAVQDMLDGKLETSCGYVCEMDMTPGVWSGQRYDARQKSIVYNHVALVSAGRAGSDVRVKLDSADAIMVHPSSSNSGKTAEEINVKKIKIDGVEYEVSEQVAQAYEKWQAAQTAKLDAAESTAKTAKTEAEQFKAKFDAAESERVKLDGSLKAANEPKAIDARVAARVALVSGGKAVLGEGEKFDGKSDDEIKRLVIGKMLPDVKLDGKSADYIAASFDSCMARFDAENPGLAAIRAGAERVDADESGSAGNVQGGAYEKARAKYKQDSADAWRGKEGKLSVGTFRQ